MGWERKEGMGWAMDWNEGQDCGDEDGQRKRDEVELGCGGMNKWLGQDGGIDYNEGN